MPSAGLSTFQPYEVGTISSVSQGEEPSRHSGLKYLLQGPHLGSEPMASGSAVQAWKGQVASGAREGKSNQNQKGSQPACLTQGIM